MTVDGEAITTTLEHPFYVEDKGWVDAKDLQIADQVRNADEATGEVEQVTAEETTHEMYNLTVDQAHTFYVGDGQWLVHNSCGSAKLSDNLYGYKYDNMDAHHLIPEELSDRDFVKLARKAGWDHNEWYNGILLPDNIPLSIEKNLPAHIDGHPAYRSYMRDQLDQLQSLASAENWSSKRAYNELRNLAQDGENIIRCMGGGGPLP